MILPVCNDSNEKNVQYHKGLLYLQCASFNLNRSVPPIIVQLTSEVPMQCSGSALSPEPNSELTVRVTMLLSRRLPTKPFGEETFPKHFSRGSLEERPLNSDELRSDKFRNSPVN
jgi:hypothetical protein